MIDRLIRGNGLNFIISVEPPALFTTVGAWERVRPRRYAAFLSKTFAGFVF
jgi:hypothetical protein